jgi:hypothetical protein
VGSAEELISTDIKDRCLGIHSLFDARRSGRDFHSFVLRLLLSRVFISSYKLQVVFHKMNRIQIRAHRTQSFPLVILKVALHPNHLYLFHSSNCVHLSFGFLFLPLQLRHSTAISLSCLLNSHVSFSVCHKIDCRFSGDTAQTHKNKDPNWN